MCTLLYGRQPYSEDFSVDTDEKNYNICKAQCRQVFFPNGEIICAKIHICAGFLVNKYPPMRTEKYQLILGGLEMNDVILVIHNDNNNKLEAIELIQNLSRDYIDFMFLSKPNNKKRKSPGE